jgi:hypothetical protein
VLLCFVVVVPRNQCRGYLTVFKQASGVLVEEDTAHLTSQDSAPAQGEVAILDLDLCTDVVPNPAVLHQPVTALANKDAVA